MVYVAQNDQTQVHSFYMVKVFELGHSFKASDMCGFYKQNIAI